MTTNTIITVKGVLKRCIITSEDGDEYIIRMLDDGRVRTGFFQLRKLPRWWDLIRVLEIETQLDYCGRSESEGKRERVDCFSPTFHLILTIFIFSPLLRWIQHFTIKIPESKLVSRKMYKKFILQLEKSINNIFQSQTKTLVMYRSITILQ